MSIREIALELYRVQRKIDALEKELSVASASSRQNLCRDLCLAQTEERMLRTMLDAKKDSSSLPKKFT